MEIEGGGSKPKRKSQEGNRVQLVRGCQELQYIFFFYFSILYFCPPPPHTACVYIQLMLQSWNNSIFLNVRDKLLLAAMKFLYSERNGEAFDSQLVVGVRESFGERRRPVEEEMREGGVREGGREGGGIGVGKG